MEWVNCVDASKLSVEKTLRQGDRIGLSPGGIAGKFVDYYCHLIQLDKKCFSIHCN
jgi:hypothetical protein